MYGNYVKYKNSTYLIRLMELHKTLKLMNKSRMPIVLDVNVSKQEGLKALWEVSQVFELVCI